MEQRKNKERKKERQREGEIERYREREGWKWTWWQRYCLPPVSACNATHESNVCLIGSNSEMLLGCCQGRASAGASVVTFCLLWLEHVGTATIKSRRPNISKAPQRFWSFCKHRAKPAFKILRMYIIIYYYRYYYLFIYIYIYGVWCPLQTFAASGTLACEARAELVAAQYAGSSAAKHGFAPDVIWCNMV